VANREAISMPNAANSASSPALAPLPGEIVCKKAAATSFQGDVKRRPGASCLKIVIFRCSFTETG
jgi:hypothetical protein